MGLRQRRPSSLLLARALEGLTVLLVIVDIVPNGGYPHPRQKNLKSGAWLAYDRGGLTD